jgi:hypothetical protein
LGHVAEVLPEVCSVLEDAAEGVCLGDAVVVKRLGPEFLWREERVSSFEWERMSRGFSGGIYPDGGHHNITLLGSPLCLFA